MSINEALEEMIRRVFREEVADLNLKPARPDDKLLTAEQAAELLQCDKTFLYKNYRDLPYAVVLKVGPTRSMVRYSHNRIQKEIERKLKERG